MKRILLISAMILSLSGCALFGVKPVQPEPQIVKQTEYVVRIPPKELMTLPAPVPPIDVDTAKQSDVAAWVLQKEQYSRTLENMLKDVAGFFNTQQIQLDQAAKTQNIQLDQTIPAK